MQWLRLAALGLLFVANLATAGAVIPFWEEEGDAGDRTTPQNVTGGPYLGIIGDIGGPTPEPFDRFDAYRFFFEGGEFGVAVFGFTKPLEIRLFSDALSEISPESEEEYIESWGVLSGGNYILEFETTEDPFMQAFLTGAISAPASVPSVPEPGTWALIALGLATLLRMRQRVRA
jgi:hypothetical protein